MGSRTRAGRTRGVGSSRRRRGQAMVEFALTAPLLLLVIFAVVDASRAVYYYTLISADAQEAARIMTLPADRTSDCRALASVVQNGNGLALQPDPASVQGNRDPAPNAPATFVATTQPPANVGFVYLYPAQAPTIPQLSGAPGTCTAPAAGAASKARTQDNYPYIAVMVRYRFEPWTPLVGAVIPQITLQAVATAVPECPTSAC